MMKHESFHLRFFLKIFVFKGVNDSTKSLHVWRFVMIQATSTPMWWASNTINVNKWNFTSLMPKVAFIEIAPLSPNETMACSWYGVCIPIVNGKWIPLTSFTSWKEKHMLIFISNINATVHVLEVFDLYPSSKFYTIIHIIPWMLSMENMWYVVWPQL